MAVVRTKPDWPQLATPGPSWGEHAGAIPPTFMPLMHSLRVKPPSEVPRGPRAITVGFRMVGSVLTKMLKAVKTAEPSIFTLRVTDPEVGPEIIGVVVQLETLEDSMQTVPIVRPWTTDAGNIETRSGTTSKREEKIAFLGIPDVGKTAPGDGSGVSI